MVYVCIACTTLFTCNHIDSHSLPTINCVCHVKNTLQTQSSIHVTMMPCVNVDGGQKIDLLKIGCYTARRVASTRKNHEKTHLGNSSLVFRPLGRRQRRARGRSAVGGLSRKRAYAWKAAPALESFARVARQHVEHVIRLAPSQPRLRIFPLGGVQGTCKLPFPASQKHFFFFYKGGGFYF